MAKKGYRRAKSLDQLMRQFNLACPGRDTSSDGWIGDAAHASRNSDHNPWVIDGDGVPVVTAQDIDEDLGDGLSLKKVIDEICRSKDPRVKYIIYEGMITVQGSKLQRWKKYTGNNAHKLHAHISVHSDQKLFDDTSEWSLGLAKQTKAAVEEPAVIQPEPQKPADVPAEQPPALVDPPPDIVEQLAEQPAAVSKVEPPNNSATAGENFPAYVPQIDTAKSWLQRLFAGTTIGTALAFVFNLPLWLQIGLFSLVVLIVVAGLVIFIKYHKEIFAYVGKMNTLRAAPGSVSPFVAGRPPAT